MSKRKTLKVDLRRNARDFVAVSWNDFPMLDPANLNDSRLHRVFGRLLGHAERHGDTVNFFIVNDHGNCPHTIECEPATPLEIQKYRGLRADLKRFQQKLYPRNHAEAPIDLKGVRSHFEELRSLPQNNQSAHFWKWRIHPRDAWKLVWFWGFAPKDLELCGPAICTKIECECMFLLRNGSNICPLCGSVGQMAKRVLNENGDKTVTWSNSSGRGTLGRGMTAMLLLLFLGAILFFDLSPASRYQGWIGFRKIASAFFSNSENSDSNEEAVIPPEDVTTPSEESADENQESQIQIDPPTGQASENNAIHPTKEDEGADAQAAPLAANPTDDPEEKTVETSEEKTSEPKPPSGGERLGGQTALSQGFRVTRLQRRSNTFSLVLSSPVSNPENFEYRLTVPNAKEEPNWVQAKSILDLSSPQMPIMQAEHVYTILIERRDRITGKVETSPYRFKVDLAR